MTDRRYGVNQYGDGSLYGSSDTREALAWGVEVDWDQDGAFDGTNEADHMIGIQTFRGRRKFVRPRGQGFEPMQNGSAVIELDNHDGRYDGWNASSPLYPNVTYGADVRVKVRDLNSGTVYDVFYGVVTDITVSGTGNDARASLYISDAWFYLRDYTARVAIQESIDPATALGYVLDYIGWPGRWGRTLGSTSDTINYFWASGNKQAGTVIEEIVGSYLGYFFLAADGKATYIPRTDTTASGVELTQAELLKDMGNPQPIENFRNVTRIKAHPRTLAATGVIWQLQGDTPSIQAGESKTIWANYTYSDQPVPAKSVVSPVATTDYTMNTQSDGGGSNLTSNFTVTLTDFGDTAKLVVTNGSASVGYVTKLQIRGDAIYEANAADITYPADISTVSQPRELLLDLPWQQDLNVAKDFSDLVGPFMATLHPYPAVRVESRPDVQFALDLFDIATVTIYKLGISGSSYRVAGIEHRSLGRNCQNIQTTFYLEPYISFENFWTFPIADFDTDTVFGA